MIYEEAIKILEAIAKHADNWYGCATSIVDDLNIKFPEFHFELMYSREVNKSGGHWNGSVDDLRRSREAS